MASRSGSPVVWSETRELANGLCMQFAPFRHPETNTFLFEHFVSRERIASVGGSRRTSAPGSEPSDELSSFNLPT